MDNRIESRTSGLRWLAWVPLLGVGALMFWSMALGLGVLSLGIVDGLASESVEVEFQVVPSAVDTVSGHANVINVNIEESAEVEDVNDNADAIEHASIPPTSHD
jgi:hypothetical protein